MVENLSLNPAAPNGIAKYVLLRQEVDATLARRRQLEGPLAKYTALRGEGERAAACMEELIKTTLNRRTEYGNVLI